MNFAGLITHDATGIAFEHCRWAEEQGMTPGQVIASVGAKYYLESSPSWGDARKAVEQAWYDLNE